MEKCFIPVVDIRIVYLNGRICLLNSTLFGLMCLFVVYVIHPPILSAVQRIPLSLLWVINAALLIYFSIAKMFLHFLNFAYL